MAGRKKPTGPLVGKEALTIVKTATGSHAYVYAGQPVPSDVADEELQRLYDEGFITDAPKVVEEQSTSAAASAPSRSRGKGGAKAPAKPETQEPPVAPATESESSSTGDDTTPPEGADATPPGSTGDGDTPPAKE